MVKQFGFIRNDEESCVYKKFSGSAKAFLILYVDDILLIGNDVNFLSEIKDSLKKSFFNEGLRRSGICIGHQDL